MADLLVPTEGHEFISPQEAQWLAVDALFVSLARQLEFDEVFGGGLSKYYRAWLFEIAKKKGRPAGFTQLTKLKATEPARAVFDDPKNSVWRVIEEDLLPLRMVIEGVMSGASQKDAMERVSEALMRPDGFRTEFVNDPEFADAMPKTLRHSSVKRLEQLWRKYRSVFHYILIWYAGFLRTRAGHELEPVPDALRTFSKISSRIEASSRTKRLLLPEPTVLKFVSAADYSASMIDSGCVYSLILGKDEARVELSLQRSSRDENKWIYDQLEAARPAIDDAFGAEMDWRRMEDKKSSRIQFSKSFDGFNRESWPEMIRWLGVHVEKLETAFAAPLSELNNRLKSGEVGK